MYFFQRKASKVFCRHFKPSSQNLGIPSCSCSMFNCCSEGLHISLYQVVMFTSKICLKLKEKAPVITPHFVLILRSHVLFQKSNVIFKRRFVYRPLWFKYKSNKINFKKSQSSLWVRCFPFKNILQHDFFKYIFELGIDIFQVFNGNNQNPDLTFLELFRQNPNDKNIQYSWISRGAFPGTNTKFLKSQP